MGISRIGRADYPCCGHCLCVTYPHCTDGETGDTCRWCMTDSDTGLSHDTKQMEASSQAIQSQSTPSQVTTNVYVTRRRRFHVSDGEPKRWTPVTITRREFVDHRMYPFRALLPILISVPMCDDLLCRKVPARMAPTDCLWKTVGEFKKLNIRLIKIGCLCGYMTEKKHYMSEQRNDFISSLLTWENGGTKQEAHGIYVIMSTTGGPLTSSALYHNIHANSETQSCRCDVLETLERFISRLPSGEHLNVYTTLDTTSTIGIICIYCSSCIYA